METGKNTQIHRALRRENSAVVKCWCSSVFGFTKKLGFFGEAVAVVFNLVIESLERLLHGGNAFLELVALLEEQGLAGADVLSPCWNRATYSMSASICRPAARIHLINSIQLHEVWS